MAARGRLLGGQTVASVFDRLDACDVPTRVKEANTLCLTSTRIIFLTQAEMSSSMMSFDGHEYEGIDLVLLAARKLTNTFLALPRWL